VVIKNKAPAWVMARALSGHSRPQSRNHKAAIQNCSVDISEPVVTPAAEIVHLIRYKQADGLSQLFLKEKSVKTHFSEHSFDIIQHGKQG